MIVANTNRGRIVALNPQIEYTAVTRLPEDLRDDPNAIVSEVARVLEYDGTADWVVTANPGDAIRISTIVGLKHR